MIKTILQNFALSVLLTIVIIVILFLTHATDYIFVYMHKIRGISNYEAEDLGRENMDITIGIIIPVVFLISFIAIIIFRRMRRKKKQNSA